MKLKVLFFLLQATKIILMLLKAKYQTQIVERPKFRGHAHTAKAFSFLEHIYTTIEHHGKLISLRV